MLIEFNLYEFIFIELKLFEFIYFLDQKRTAKKKKRTKRIEDAVKEKEVTIPSQGKSAMASDKPNIRWLELIKERKILYQVVSVDLDELKHAMVNSVFPIIYWSNSKDIDDIAN